MNHAHLALIGPILSKEIETSFPQIAVDGGIHFATNPIMWVGDGDSGEVDSSIPLLKKPSQDETDLHFCLNQIQEWNWNHLHLFGFLGGRKDHEYANLGEVCQALKKRPQSRTTFYDENMKPCIDFYASGDHFFTFHGIFSILTFEKTRITLSGECRYPVKEEELAPFSGRGISNVGAGAIQLKTSAPVMVI